MECKTRGRAVREIQGGWRPNSNSNEAPCVDDVEWATHVDFMSGGYPPSGHYSPWAQKNQTSFTRPHPPGPRLLTKPISDFNMPMYIHGIDMACMCMMPAERSRVGAESDSWRVHP